MSFHAPDSMKEVIVKYCYDRMKLVKPQFLKDNNIKSNILMEVMFLKAQENSALKGSHELDNTELQQIFQYTKNSESIMEGFASGRHELIGISDDDNLIFRIHKIKYID